MKESIRDRMASLSRRELVGLCVLVVIGLGGVGLWYVRSLPRPVEVQSLRHASPVATPSPSPAVILVDVAGWVRDPGVYEFSDGDRVIDAIRAAGGPKKGAALEALNLASLLTDAQQILVPQRAAAGTAGSAGVVPTTGSVPGAAGALINVNTATATELEALPGIGEVLSQAIVDYRTDNGPFPTVDALEDVSGIGPATLDDIRDLVTV